MANDPTHTSALIASNISHLRQQRKLTQASLARLAGIPRSTVTLLESGSANPSINSLLKVAGVLQISLEELLAKPQPSCQLLLAKDIPLHRKSRAGVQIKRLLPDVLPSLELDEMTLEAGAKFVGSPHIAGTREYFIGIKGRFCIEVGGESFEVRSGDVLSFDGNQLHSYRNSGKETAAGMSIVVLQAKD